MKACSSLTMILLFFSGTLATAHADTRRSGICLECHRDHADQAAMHPVFVPAPEVLGNRLPTEDGLVTCLTCHLSHGEQAAGDGRGDGRDGGSFLLRKEPESLCASCHRSGSGVWDRPHALYADSVHGGTYLAGQSGRRDRPGRAGLDEISRRCLACHDGSQAESAPFEMQASRGLGHSHPIGVRLASLGRAASDVPESVAGSRDGVRLFDGRVGCGSCHRLFSRRSARLATEMARSRLCLSCHAI